ncbi:MAG: hypothetical protein V8Q57_02545 [Blautia sp.]
MNTGSRASEAETRALLPRFCIGVYGGIEGYGAVTSNRESGFGRYDVLLEPLRKEDGWNYY